MDFTNFDSPPFDSTGSVTGDIMEDDVCHNDNGVVGEMKKLPKATVKLITSTQVITSVVSVVKELIENSLDAGSTSIDIKLDNFGFDKIEVRDNGSGIKVSDTQYMAQPHYTSKLSDTKDLATLHTYGFRGEALGSLCSVANVSITTKTVNDLVSMTYMLSNEGKVMNNKPSHLGQGTTVCASNLFKNLPVRRQFYSGAKKRKDEMKKVEELVIACGIVSHDVRFSLKHNKDMIWQKNPVADVRSVLISVFGVGSMSHMKHLERKCLEPEMTIEAFLPKPSAPWSMVTRGVNDRCFLYVNKRTVVMKDVEKLIRKFCTSALGVENNRYPLCFLHIVLNSEYVDVNLDPNKTSVLLQEKDKVIEFLTSVLEELYGIPNKQNKEELLNDKQEDKINVITQSDPKTCVVSVDGMPDESRVKDNIDMMSSNEILQTDSLIDSNKSSQIQQESNIPKIILESAASNSMSLDQNSNNSAQSNNHSDPKLNSTNVDCTDLELTMELLREFESDDITSFDVSTPKLDRTGFGPMLTSTQVNDKPCMDTETKLPLTNNDPQQSNFELQLGNDTSSVINEPGTCNSEGACGDPKQWAEGTAVRDACAKVVQPVQVLVGRPSIESESSSDSRMSAGTLDSNTTPGSSKRSSFNRDRSSVTPNQSTLFDISIKKAPSGYLYFSKELRPKVLAENPGSTFVDIATIIVEKWKVLSEEEKQEYEDLASREATWKQFEEESKTSKKESKTSSATKHSAKKRKLSREDQQDGVQKLFSNTSKPKEAVKLQFDRAEDNVPFSMACLKAAFCKGPIQSQSQEALMLIGQLQTQSAWLCCHNNHLKLFHPIRAQEELVLRRLMFNHKFTVETLESPRKLTLEFLGPSLWKTLLSLKMSTAEAVDPYNYITDPRVCSNGFRIRHRIGTDEEMHQRCLEVVAMTTSITGFSVNVLCQILEMINSCPGVKLSDCRPTLVKHFLQSEAVRMTRLSPQRVPRQEVQDLMRDLQCHLAGGTKTCFHGRPILHTLYDLDDVPRSQESGLDYTETNSQE